MRKDFSHRAYAFRGAPRVLFGRHGFGQAGVPLLVVRDFLQELGAETSGGCYRGYRRFFGRFVLRVCGECDTRREHCKTKEIKIDTTHFSLLREPKTSLIPGRKRYNSKRPWSGQLSSRCASRLPQMAVIAKWCSTRL